MTRILAIILLMAVPASAATYAELDKGGVVLRVVVIDDAAERDKKGNVDEALGITWCLNFFQNGTWVRTSENDGRKHYAGPGYTYDRANDRFVPPAPFSSWVLDQETANWQPPVPSPDDGGRYSWDEEKRAWVAVSPP